MNKLTKEDVAQIIKPFTYPYELKNSAQPKVFAVPVVDMMEVVSLIEDSVQKKLNTLDLGNNLSDTASAWKIQSAIIGREGFTFTDHKPLVNYFMKSDPTALVTPMFEKTAGDTSDVKADVLMEMSLKDDIISEYANKMKSLLPALESIRRALASASDVDENYSMAYTQCNTAIALLQDSTNG